LENKDKAKFSEGEICFMMPCGFGTEPFTINCTTMYNQTKKLIKQILPKQLLFRYELFFRFFYYQFYKGDNFECNICKSNLRMFIETGDDLMCPRCGSLARTRRLWGQLQSSFLKEGISVLDFSPSRSLFRMHKKGNYRYTSTDLSGDFIADKSFDITQIAVADNTYDLIICYHILEHINDDAKAMCELFRVLKPGGSCLIQTPFKEGLTYENKEVTTDDERLIHFGQADHVRIYSVNGLAERLEHAGFNVKKLNFAADFRFGMKSDENLLICTKTKNS